MTEWKSLKKWIQLVTNHDHTTIGNEYVAAAMYADLFKIAHSLLMVDVLFSKMSSQRNG